MTEYKFKLAENDTKWGSSLLLALKIIMWLTGGFAKNNFTRDGHDEIDRTKCGGNSYNDKR